ncbi:ergothioneine biosynthesis protein EgtB [Ramlibacter sp.]|uniref:ergothioneine biosynthesis protein EgtB n=1 Tax=Ramlibacter sp. TaxID=1917967 RepID=UPI0035B0C7B3
MTDHSEAARLADAVPAQRDALAQRFRQVRARSAELTTSLSAEDQGVQSMPDASPTKWHLAHTAWFFEAVVLVPHATGYRPFDARFFHLFNSYYDALGSRHPRPQRGLLTRPSLEEVHAFRRHVDAAVARFIEDASASAWTAAEPLLTLSLHHEQQHQELMLTDLLHAFSCNPLLPAYASASAPERHRAAEPLAWVPGPAGAVAIGHAGDGFAFDNEGPRHTVWLAPYELGHRLVTCGEYADFIADGGYRTPSLWLSEGWATVQAQGWQAPLYWLAPGDPRAPADHWQVFGLQGVGPLDPSAPVRHLSFYEAAAYAEWAGARLPTEAEWEAASSDARLTQLTGHAWQWTRSAYDPYPGYRPWSGAVGEYNGKFMVGQIVLRGGSLATPEGHTRPTYRNFFPPAARWQFTGVRLARDL